MTEPTTDMPEVRLWRAVLANAVHDAMHGVETCRLRNWAASPDFAVVVTYAGGSPEAVECYRARMLKLINAGETGGGNDGADKPIKDREGGIPSTELGSSSVIDRLSCGQRAGWSSLPGTVRCGQPRTTELEKNRSLGAQS
jgi:hypothetical protein